MEPLLKQVQELHKSGFKGNKWFNNHFWLWSWHKLAISQPVQTMYMVLCTKLWQINGPNFPFSLVRRQNVPHVSVVFTDGRSQDDVSEWANKAKNSGAVLYLCQTHWSFKTSCHYSVFCCFRGHKIRRWCWTRNEPQVTFWGHYFTVQNVPEHFSSHKPVL